MNTIHDLIQGSPQWHAFRLEHFGASEAAAMLGLSKRVTRTELLRAKKTGIPREYSEWMQTNILDRGHRVEALARPHVEAMIGKFLYPVTMSDDLISASCDGITMDDHTAWECKQWNEESAAQVRAGLVPAEHMPQCQQVLMVTGAKQLIFTVTDGTPERIVHVQVLPDPAWFERLRAGWRQFAQDLAELVEADLQPTPPAPAGRAPDMLPALRVELSGAVTASNLSEFKTTALAAIRSVKRELNTDEDFADAAASIKWCTEVESRLAAAKQHALSQTVDIDALFRTMDEISAEARRVRLDLEKLDKARKDSIRTEIVIRSQAALDEHVLQINARLGANWLPRITGPFADAIKGKKTIASLKDAANVALANAKIDASALADRLQANRKALTEEDGTDWLFLFADFATMGAKPVDDFCAIAAQRIQKHKDEQRAVEDRRKAVEDATRAAVATAAALAPAPASAAQTAPATAAGPVVLLHDGAIGQRLEFVLTVDFIEQRLGVPRHSSEKRATYWTERQLNGDIIPALVRHLHRVASGAVREAEAVL